MKDWNDYEDPAAQIDYGVAKVLLWMIGGVLLGAFVIFLGVWWATQETGVP